MLIDYEAFCNPSRMEHDLEVNEISPEEVKKMKLDGQTFQLIDVREPVEYQLVNIGAINIPLASLKDKLTLISQEGLVVVHCKSGQRSLLAIRKLQAEYGFKNLKNMTGGLLGWKKNVEPDLDIR